MRGRVARCGYDRHIAGPGDLQALAERAERFRAQIHKSDRRGGEPGRPPIAWVAVQGALEARSPLVLAARYQYLALGEVAQAAGVVGVQVGHHDSAHVSGRDAQRAQLRPDLFLRADMGAHSQDEIGVPTREVARARGLRGLACVYQNETLRVFYDPGIDGQRVRPGAVEEHVELPAGPVTLAFLLRLMDLTVPVCMAWIFTRCSSRGVRG